MRCYFPNLTLPSFFLIITNLAWWDVTNERLEDEPKQWGCRLENQKQAAERHYKKLGWLFFCGFVIIWRLYSSVSFKLWPSTHPSSISFAHEGQVSNNTYADFMFFLEVCDAIFSWTSVDGSDAACVKCERKTKWPVEIQEVAFFFTSEQMQCPHFCLFFLFCFFFSSPGWI